MSGRLTPERMEEEIATVRRWVDYRSAMQALTLIEGHIDAIEEELRFGNHLHAKATDRINDLEAENARLREALDGVVECILSNAETNSQDGTLHFQPCAAVHSNAYRETCGVEAALVDVRKALEGEK